ncbi:MAG: hypothetical protein LC116_04915 [Bacteroidetes bacterium]|nr:hypothetical protein [Bacteroidota bacterium]
MRIFFFIASFALLAAVCSLQANSDKTRAWGSGAGNAIELRWLPSPAQPFPAEGYTILRRRRGGITMFYPIDTVFVQPKIPDNKSISPVLRDSLASILQRAVSDKHTRTTAEDLHLAAMAHPSLFYSMLNFRFLDSSARVNTRYDYQISIGIDIVAQIFDVGRNVPSKLQPPDVKATVAGNSVRLSWKTQGMLHSGICGWKILRKQGRLAEDTLPHPILAAFFPEDRDIPFIYEDSKLKKGETYTYRIIAFDVFGRESVPGQEISAVVTSNRPLMPPVGLTARISGDSIKISWKNTWHKQNRIAGFYLYRQAGNSTVRLINTPVSDTFFTDRPGQIPVAEIAYFATAVDSAGNESEASFHSIVAVPDEIPPMRPGFVGVTPDADKLLVLWARSKSPDAAFYEIARSAKEHGIFTLISAPISDTVYEDTVGEGAAWWYKTRTVDIRGNRSDWTAAIFGKIQGKAVPPSPIIYSTGNYDRNVSLKWMPIDFPALAGYWVNRYEDTTYTPITINAKIIPPAQTYYDDTSGMPDILYAYEVVAQDSNLAFSQPSLRVYGRSYDVRRPLPPIIDSLLIEDLGIIVVWKWDVAPILPFEVVVERSLDGKRYVQISPLITPPDRRYPDVSVRPGETYYYRLRTRSKRGVWSSPSASRSIEFADNPR